VGFNLLINAFTDISLRCPQRHSRDIGQLTVGSVSRECIDNLQIQVAEIKTEVKIQFREVFARVKRLEAIMIGASASIIAMLVMALTRMP
jgi:hypothetical protein